MAKKKTEGKKLLIVESPHKIKTLKKILGKNFEIKASVGHVIDLPKTKLGVDIENNYEPQYTYIRGKKKVVEELKKAAKKAEEILLAPDPDREGEAISWHLARELGISEDDNCRVTFNAITEKVVKEALKHVRPIDMNKVYAQQGRRVLDRLMGYLVSPILWLKLQKGLSAGRVQSVALHFIVDREREIFNFIPQEYWKVWGIFFDKEKKDLKIKAELEKFKGKKIELSSKEEVEDLLNAIKDKKVVVSSLKKTISRRSAPQPFKTSTLQQDASSKLGYSPKKTMMLAQRLYEGVEIGQQGTTALITYMRTDSLRIEPEAEIAIKKYIEDNYGKEYLGSKRNTKKKPKEGNVQDAHEAIRPISVELTPEFVAPYLQKDMLKLYTLIWERTVASMMKGAEIEKSKAIIAQGEAQFGILGEKLLFDGYTRVYNNLSLKENDLLAQIEEGEELEVEKYEKEQLFTKPKSRYTDASLIKELEEKGIGRPSTYATIISTLYDRKYAVREEKKIKPTDLGVIVSLLLEQNFNEVINENFTAEMEEELDKVEKGESNWRDLIDKFYRKLKSIIDRVEKQLPKVKLKTDVKCQKCGGEMLFRFSSQGKFLGCSNFPKCNHTIPLPDKELFLLNLKDLKEGMVECSERLKQLEEAGELDINKEEDNADYGVCEKCGSPMVLKMGRYGKFLACSAYPKCKNTKPLPQNLGNCPKEDCDGEIVMRRTKRGRKFYGCSNYPDCDFVSWTKPNTSSKDKQNITKKTEKKPKQSAKKRTKKSG